MEVKIMYKVNESPMVNSYANTVVDDAAVKLEILNDDVLDLVRYTKLFKRHWARVVLDVASTTLR